MVYIACIAVIMSGGTPVIRASKWSTGGTPVVCAPTASCVSRAGTVISGSQNYAITFATTTYLPVAS